MKANKTGGQLSMVLSRGGLLEHFQPMLVHFMFYLKSVSCSMAQ